MESPEFAVQQIGRKTLVESIIEQLEGLIRSQTLSAGQRLPNDRELAKAFSVSRSTVREALRSLAVMGMVEIRPGKGVFVRELVKTPSFVRYELSAFKNVDEIYEAREVIETALIMSSRKDQYLIFKKIAGIDG